MPREHKIQIIERRKKRPGKKDKIFIHARITWMENGKRKALWRSGSTRTEARDRLRDALQEQESLAVGGRFSPRTKFTAVVNWYLERYAVAPVYVESRKITGLRSSESVRANAAVLREYFAGHTLGSITYSDLENFKTTRLQTPTLRKTRQRSIASVHRELALLQRIFNIAEREGWIVRNPFRKGDSLISTADERKGTRILSPEEEVRLLNVCVGPRAHLRPILICAIDTGMRAGEMFQLRWRDVGQYIVLPAMITKTMETRAVPISNRLQNELDQLWENSLQDKDALVFGVKVITHSFKTACKKAGIQYGDPDGITFRCLRRTRSTRWIQQGLPREEVSKLLGHKVAQTTFAHYIAVDPVTLHRAKELLDKTA